MPMLLLCLTLLLVPAWVHAEAVLCGNTEKLVWFDRSVDPTRTRPCPAPYIKQVIPKAQNPEQLALYDATARKDHLKVVDGLLVLMTPAEQAAVDAVLAAQRAERETYVQALSQPGVCHFDSLHHLEQVLASRHKSVETRLQAAQATLQSQIDALSALDVTTLKTLLTQLTTATFLMGKDLHDDYAHLVRQVATCDFARSKVRLPPS